MIIAVLSEFAHRCRVALAVSVAVFAMAASRPADAQLPSIARDPVDLVIIYKSDRLLELKRKGQVVHSFKIALGAEPEGHKLAEGDSRTPEGVYTLDWRNPHSQFYRSIHISYPHAMDQASALRRGVSPGGLVMIHGLPNGRRADEMNHPANDWTNGCIAVTNDEMDQIWSLVEDGTTIIIFP
ncbi:MAG: L,D-transpeptidase family protein [Rhizobiales bacterium]|nr:L,D-transpeptidase family protein [Hyphomicrobiales bacterium]